MKKIKFKNKMMCISIIVLFIIVLSTITSVIGFQTFNISKKNHSPLFRIKSIKINNQETINNLKIDYLGKNLNKFIPFSIKNNTLFLFREIVDGISKMNDINFKKFLDKTISSLKISKEVNEKYLAKIKEIFIFIKENPNEAKKFPFKFKQHSYTLDCPPPTFSSNPRICFSVFVFLFIAILTIPIWLPIYLALMFIKDINENISCNIIPLNEVDKII